MSARTRPGGSTVYKSATQYNAAYTSPNGGNWSASLKASLIAVWPFNGNAEDVYSGFDLTAVNSPTYGTGHVNAQAADLEASSSQSFSHVDADAFSPATGLTIMGWGKLESTPNSNCPISKYQTGSTEYLPRANANGTFKWLVIFTGGSVELTSSQGGFDDNDWHQFIFGYDASGNTYCGVDAVVSTTTYTGSPPANTGSLLRVGRWGTGNFWDGLIGPVAMWSVWKGQDAVNEFYNSGSGLPYG